MPFATLLNLPWSAGVNQRHMARWAPGDRAQVAKSNGLGVAVEAYFIRVQAEGPESPNCHSTTDVDFHEWVVADPADDRTKAVVVEVGLRQRDKHAGWTLARLPGECGLFPLIGTQSCLVKRTDAASRRCICAC